jgi:dTDP-4-dehydrorhamnose reductase
MLTDKQNHYSRPEVWGGIECTINRVGNDFRDQLVYSGHYSRPDDLKSFAALGIKALRYPVLWEAHQKTEGEEIDWTYTSERLYKIKDLEINCIAGLLHHGSGPLFTSLNDPLFPVKFASYAAKVARQFPWLQYYTPVNEPLTTARFSGLYGFWHPHITSASTFIFMLLNELKATVLAMRAIRKINPNAVLIQTEDLGKTYSTPVLQYQADFENERRWLTFDLLSGNVDRSHPLWDYLLSLKIQQEQLEFFLENKCPPDILGLNYYVTSERFLDHEYHLYPAHLCGTNSIHKYADVEAVRVPLETPSGLSQLLSEAWQRFHVPIAVTEAHLACTREEQMRWFKHIWDICSEAKNHGIGIKAVTAWSLLGSFDWNSMLTKSSMEYESGVFDVRDKNLRVTALAKLIKDIATNGDSEHPVLSGKGWWQKEDRYLNKSASASACYTTNSNPVLIIGENKLASAFEYACTQRMICYKIIDENEVGNEEDMEGIIEKHKPWAILNTYEYNNINEAENREALCYTINVKLPTFWAAACKKHAIPFISFSSDMVFDGSKKAPYLENDIVRPVNVFGKTKSKAEEEILKLNEYALVIRTGPLFANVPNDFSYWMLNEIEKENEIKLPEDIIISPAFVTDIANVVLDLMIDEANGIWHVNNKGKLSWYGFACGIAESCGFSSKAIAPVPVKEMNWNAKVPDFSVIESVRGINLPSLENALERFSAGFHSK